jgi:hypothetical protein
MFWAGAFEMMNYIENGSSLNLRLLPNLAQTNMLYLQIAAKNFSRERFHVMFSLMSDEGKNECEGFRLDINPTVVDHTKETLLNS